MGLFKTGFLIPLAVLGLFMLSSCEQENEEEKNTNTLQLVSVKTGAVSLSPGDTVYDIPVSSSFKISFSSPVDTTTIRSAISIQDASGTLFPYVYSSVDEGEAIIVEPAGNFLYETKYTLHINNTTKGLNDESFPGVSFFFYTTEGVLTLKTVTLNGNDFLTESPYREIPLLTTFVLAFDFPVEVTGLSDKIRLFSETVTPISIAVSEDKKTIRIENEVDLDDYARYNLFVSSGLTAENGYKFEGFVKDFFTRLDSSYKFPEISNEALLDKIQEQTFTYFYDYAHPVSGLTRERNTSGDVVTAGGTGFGLMAMPVGIERGYISRADGIARLTTMIDFLTQADRFHGVWPHWLNGVTGEVIPFSPDDDGGDLVETSYVAMGLMTVRQYLNPSSTKEEELIQKINILLESIEWDFYTQGNNSLTWHWSPNTGFEKNMKIRGWNEALITYVMAASSENYSITKAVYDEGWAKNGGMKNGNSFYGITLPLGPDYGGPLFFEQYTFLGLDPRNLADQYATYWDQVRNHSLINQAYCIANPKDYIGYSADSWGLTASDGDQGYSAHSPTNDRGVITPTASISSIAFTPAESMKAIRHFYYRLGERLWGPHGFYDAFNITEGWYADSYIAIDQGPILLMIENYRSALLWQLFMSSDEIQQGLTKLGFTYQ